MGWFSDMLFGKRKKLDIGKIQGYMEPAQALVNRQVGFSDMFTDLDSPFNRQYQGLLQNLAQTQGQQTGSNLLKMAAMRNVSPGQALMQSSTAQNQAQGQGYNHEFSWKPRFCVDWNFVRQRIKRKYRISR